MKEVANGLGEPLFVTALDYLRPFEIPEADQLHHYKSFPKSLWLFPLSMHSCYAKCSKQYMQIALPSVEFFVLEFLGTSHGNIPVFLPRKVNTAQLPSNDFYLRTTPEHEWHPLSHCNNSHRGSSPWCSSSINSFFFGKESLDALQMKCQILFGTFNDQISNQNFLWAIVFDGLGFFATNSFERRWYADLVE